MDRSEKEQAEQKSNNKHKFGGVLVGAAGSSDTGGGSECKAVGTGPLRDLGPVGTLIEAHTDEGNGLNDQVEEWEEVEFLVDSGASATVIGDGGGACGQAVRAEPGPQLQVGGMGIQ